METQQRWWGMIKDEQEIREMAQLKKLSISVTDWEQYTGSNGPI